MTEDVAATTGDQFSRVIARGAAPRIPLPIVTGAIGLLLAYVTPGGLGGGGGFVFVLLAGFASLFAVALLRDRSEREGRKKKDARDE